MQYTLAYINEAIACLAVPDRYTRAMLFCRAQEFYESPCRKFKGKAFSIWDYFSWYAKASPKKCFSYPSDYVGFNVPVAILAECYSLCKAETPYDDVMKNLAFKLLLANPKSYLIGAPSLSDSTFKHELAHAFYHTNTDYKSEVDKLTAKIPAEGLKQFKSNLKDLGYCSAVMKDEIQAYLATGLTFSVSRDVSGTGKLQAKYKAVFEMYRREFT